MPPKKKDKSKAADWLQCSLCNRVISNSDAEAHSSCCNRDCGYIEGKVLHGRAVKANSILEEDGTPVTKSIRNSDGTIWLSIPAMQVCGLSIGQHCVVNNVCVMRSWPAKMPALTSVAITGSCLELLGLVVGGEVTVQRFLPTETVTESCALRLQEQSPVFETEEFCNFASSYLDGCFITEDSPLQIRYFGQVCVCSVDSICHGVERPSPELQNANTAAYSSQLADTPHKQVSQRDASSFTESPQTNKVADLDNDSVLNATNTDLSESLASLNISDAAQNIHASTPKSSQKPNYSHLGTPQFVRTIPTCDHKFSRICSKVTRISTVSCDSSGTGGLKDDGAPGPVLADLGGLSSQIEELKSRIQRAQHTRSSSRCILLYGPPGTGKTMLAKALTSQLDLHSVHVSGTDVWSKLFGEAESNLKRLFTDACDRAPSIIVMDDIDVICPRRSQNHGGQQENRIVGTLLALIDGITSMKGMSKPVVVLGVTNNRDGLDPALRRAGRFGCEVEVPVPSAVARVEILKVLLGKLSHRLSDSELTTVAGNAHGYVGADLSALVNEACMQAFSRHQSDGGDSGSSREITLEDLVNAGLQVKPSALREVQLEVPQVRWSDIGGMSEVKMRLREAVELPLSRPEVFKELGIEPPRGLLMYGPPGCSKTMVARALATECRLNFLAVKGPELFNQYVGESEKAIREVFRKARAAAPSVIFFDEIDAIAAKRGSSGSSSGVEDRVLTQLLTEMDGLEHLKDVFIMAATNRPDKMDNALLRPGRFDSLVYVPLPDDVTRGEILEKKLGRMCVAGDVLIDQLVEGTLDYSGAEIIQVCQEAALFALREDINAKCVHWRHFEFALTKVQPQIDPALLQIYTKFSHLKLK
ncbi:ATPase family protein 2 homolog [Aplysia californica]|uniref:ATPase family protein 2 homolog n=1 Tax=Aplysia californica TaxID=6500 RepID=A0ABM1VV89_APLCA|nr:ATPase family protein 2 homolog [Aplysia californica]XP_035826331.1 ATPase family protein 2 homolog [Aplysia californica]